jgi:DNA-binding MarR family transcriptional regulator
MSTNIPFPSTLIDPGLYEDARRLNEALGELVRIVQFRDRDRACCYDLTASQCYALKGIVEAGGITVNDLAARLYCDKSTASRLAQALVDKGYVLRQRDKEDARVVRLVPTATGAALCAAVETTEAHEYAALLADFEPVVRAEIIRLVSKLGRCFASNVHAEGGSCCVVK